MMLMNHENETDVMTPRMMSIRRAMISSAAASEVSQVAQLKSIDQELVACQNVLNGTFYLPESGVYGLGVYIPNLKPLNGASFPAEGISVISDFSS